MPQQQCIHTSILKLFYSNLEVQRQKKKKKAFIHHATIERLYIIKIDLEGISGGYVASKQDHPCLNHFI